MPQGSRKGSLGKILSADGVLPRRPSWGCFFRRPPSPSRAALVRENANRAPVALSGDFRSSSISLFAAQWLASPPSHGASNTHSLPRPLRAPGDLHHGNLVGTPATNIGIFIAGRYSPTWSNDGAAMLLVRPLVRAGAERKHKVHTFIFIFLVCNSGGLLRVADPPFLGFYGDPLHLTLSHLWLSGSSW